ncbi:MAG: response regulator [Euryarchaeota archaeon]|nr:response regulator [Euryarchaeota archaeon]
MLKFFLYYAKTAIIKGGRKKMQKERILIVEDAIYMREMLVEMFGHKKEKYEVVDLAVNGKEAVEKYKELKQDIVSMDLVMEVMEGIQAIRDIKNLFDAREKQQGMSEG